MTAEPEHRSIPRLGLGTFGRTGDEGQKAMLEGIELGYRHLDTAQSYDTEAGVGRAVKQSGLPRAEFFITTKIADTNLTKTDFRPSLEKSLETLGMDYVNLTLIHWPSAGEFVPLEDYMTELVRAKEDGLTRLIGVSNFTIDLLERSAAIIGHGRLATNQVELHPFLQNRKLLDSCRSQEIALTAYLPLAKGRVAHNALLQQIGGRHNATAPQIALAFLLHQDIIAIPASSQRANMESNLGARDIVLSDSEIEEIRALDRGQRFVDPAKAPAWD